MPFLDPDKNNNEPALKLFNPFGPFLLPQTVNL